MCSLWVFVLRYRSQKHRSGPSQTHRKKQLFCFFANQEARRRFLRSAEETRVFDFAGRFEEDPFPMKKHGVGSGSIGSFILACFQATICLEVDKCCIGTFSHRAMGFQIIFHPAGPVGSNKNSLLGVVLSLQFVSVKLVMFCVNIMSDGLQCVFVLLCFCFAMFSLMVLVTVGRR